MASRLEFRKPGDAVREAGWEPKWLKLNDLMCDWERQINVWASKHAILDNEGEVENDMNAEMEDV